MIQTSCTVCFWDFLQDKEARCLTVSLSYSSASEDLGCRRGDFSRKHYGSVELVSPTHSALVCSHLFLSQQLLCPPLVLSSLVLSGLLPRFVVVRMSAVRGRQWVVTFWVWSSSVASKMLLCLDVAEKEKKKTFAAWETVSSAAELLSHCCFGGVDMCERLLTVCASW